MFWALTWGWLVLLIAPSSATKALYEHGGPTSVGPIEKVIELLGVLSKDLIKEGQDDSAAHAKFVKLNTNETAHYKTIAEVNLLRKKQQVNGVKQSQVNKINKQQELISLANKQAKLEGEQSADTEGRKADRAAFEKSQAVTTASLLAIDSAIKTLQKKNPHAVAATTTAAPAAKSMLQFAQQFERTLAAGGSDFSLDASQRQTLESFMRAAKASEQDGDSSQQSTDVETSADQAEGSSTQADSGQQSSDEAIIAPSFLQHSSRLRGVSLVQNKHSAQGVSGILATLMSLRKKVKLESDTQIAKETKDGLASTKFQKVVAADINAVIYAKGLAKKAIQDYKAEVSKGTEDLGEAKRLYSAATTNLQNLAKTLKLRTESYKARLAKRSDENLALTEAKNILGAEIVQKYIAAGSWGKGKKYTVAGPAPGPAPAAAPSPAPAILGFASSFLQLSQEHLQDKKPDVFAAVKMMVRDMIKKLKAKQAAELAKAAFCAKEMEQAKLRMKNRAADIAKLGARLTALDVEIAELKRQISSLGKDLGDMKKANATATTIRNEEAPKVKEKLQTYKSAAALVNKAVGTLRKYYNAKNAAGSKGSSKGSNTRANMGAGVIGILEIAAADYNKLQKTTKEAEAAAQASYVKMLNDNEIMAAQFTKTLEYKKADLVKQETAKLEWKADLKSFKAELANVDAALAALMKECFKKAPTYAEMKAKQEAELAALKEAQGYLANGRR